MNNLTSRFQRFIARLSPAQRLIAGTLIVVMIVVGFWASGRSSARDELVAVLDQPFAETEVARISDHLHSKAIAHQIRDGRVLVATSRRMEVISELYSAGILNTDTASGFDELVKKMSPWDAPSKTDRMFNHVREVTVQQVIEQNKAVRKATVMIDPTNERRLGGTVLPSAMVDIQTRGGGNPRQLATAAINVVTGAVANMQREQVRVTVDGATYNADGETRAADDLVQRRQQSEQMHVAKVRQLLSYIPEVLVSVSVELESPVEETVRAEDRPLLENSQAQARDGAAATTTESTVIANAVPLLQELSAVANAVTAPQPPAAEPHRAARAAAAVEMVRSASVAVPRSYFVQIYLRANRKGQEPTDALLQPVVDAHLPKIRSLVKNALGLADDTDVTVESYEDGLVAAPASVAQPALQTAAASVAPMLTINSYAREIALATLGAVALLVMSLVFRRPPVVAADASIQSTPLPASREVVTGTIEDTGSADAEAHHLFRRVRDMVSDNPDDAARVLRGWIHQG
jgi:flagellar biosynthesis/type III secretory pathway M-ring protein FliF/YscJ